MADEIRAGDLVHLKSGGPTMTAESVSTEHNITLVGCAWFEGKQLRRQTFSPAALAKGQSPEDAPPTYA
jgi:uncharacterized protein YodC (DUF2158 family)